LILLKKEILKIGQANILGRMDCRTSILKCGKDN